MRSDSGLVPMGNLRAKSIEQLTNKKTKDDEGQSYGIIEYANFKVA